MYIHLLKTITTMRIIRVASLPLAEVIRDLSKEFKTTNHTLHREHLLNLPEQVGQGSIRAMEFEGGLGVIRYDCNFNHDLEIQFTVNKVHPLKFLYVTQGSLNHRFANENQLHTVNQFQNAIVASSDKNGHILQFKKGVSTCVFSIEIDRASFKSKSENFQNGMDPSLKRLFDDGEADESFYYEGDYSLKMADLFKKINTFEGGDFLRYLFLESIAHQTLVEQIIQYIDDQRQEKNQTLLRRQEVDAIKRAADYIEANLASYKSMPELTKHTGLNAAKLQQGFKHLYDKTVNQYVHEARLNRSKELLLDTDDNISEITYKVGLSSKSYFSRIFKEEYGIQPSLFRKNQKE